MPTNYTPLPPLKKIIPHIYMDSMRANVSILHVDIETSLITDFSMTRRMSTRPWIYFSRDRHLQNFPAFVDAEVRRFAIFLLPANHCKLMAMVNVYNFAWNC